MINIKFNVFSEHSINITCFAEYFEVDLEILIQLFPICQFFLHDDKPGKFVSPVN